MTRFHRLASLPIIAIVAACLGLAIARTARAECALAGNIWPSGAPQFQCINTGMPCTQDSQCGSTSGLCQLLGTHDTSHTALWCNFPDVKQELWKGLKIDKDDWEGFGWFGGPTCDPDDHLTRLMNAAALVRRVSLYSKPYGIDRFIYDWAGHLEESEFESSVPPVGGFFAGDWWSYAKKHIDDEWVPSCEDDFTWSSTPSGGLMQSQTNAKNTYGEFDDVIKLFVPGAYRESAITRAGTVVHETVHSKVKHLEQADDCAATNSCPCANNGSCDVQYGLYNAQTMNINFLYDAVVTYLMTQLDGKKVHMGQTLWNFGGPRMCSYAPLLSLYERLQAFNMATAKRNSTFQYPDSATSYASLADLHDLYSETWNCDECDSSQWEFDPNVCEQKACNQALNPDDALVNVANRYACQTYNDTVETYLYTPEGIELAQEQYTQSLFGCFGPSAAGTDSYCEQQKAAVGPNGHVDDIDSCGWLEDAPAAGTNRVECLVSYCEESFQPEWAGHAGEAGWSDPLGCLDTLCQDDAFCRDMFLTWRGDPDHYLRPDEPGGCERPWLECYYEAGVQPSDCSVGELCPTIALEEKLECDKQLQFCQELEQHGKNLLEMILGLQWQQPIGPPDPGPLAEFWQRIWELHGELESGAIGEREFAVLRDELYADPEMVAALYDSGPELFVELFGTETYAAIAGPSIEQVVPADLQSYELSQEALGELTALEELRSVESYFEPESLESEFTRVRTSLDDAEYISLLREVELLDSLNTRLLLINTGL